MVLSNTLLKFFSWTYLCIAHTPALFILCWVVWMRMILVSSNVWKLVPQLAGHSVKAIRRSVSVWWDVLMGRELRLTKAYDIPSVLSGYCLYLKMWDLVYPSEKLCYAIMNTNALESLAVLSLFFCKLPYSWCFIIKRTKQQIECFCS